MNSFYLEVTHLKTALIGLGKIIRKRPSLPVLGYMRVSFQAPDQVELAGTDLDSWITCTMPAAGQSLPAAALLPYQELNHIVKTCAPEDSLELCPADAQTFLIKCQIGDQKVEHRVATLPIDEFPEVPVFNDAVVALPPTLPSALQMAQACASSDATRYVLNGAYLDVSQENGHYVVGTDGRHLVASNSFNLPLGRSLIVPNHKFLEWKGFVADGEWKLNLQSADPQTIGLFQISSNQWRFIGREIDGPYPNWRHVFPEPDIYKA